MALPGRGEASGDVAVGRHAQVGCRVPAGGGRVGLGELCDGGGEADLEAFRLAGPAFTFCLGDACGEAGADVAESLPLGGVDAEHRAADAAVLVDAAGSVCPAAVAEGEFAAFEVSLHLSRMEALIARSGGCRCSAVSE